MAEVAAEAVAAETVGMVGHGVAGIGPFTITRSGVVWMMSRGDRVHIRWVYRELRRAGVSRHFTRWAIAGTFVAGSSAESRYVGR